MEKKANKYETLLGEKPTSKKVSKITPDKASVPDAGRREIRATVIIYDDLYQTIKEIAVVNRRNIKDVVQEAFEQYIERHNAE